MQATRFRDRPESNNKGLDHTKCWEDGESEEQYRHS